MDAPPPPSPTEIAAAAAFHDHCNSVVQIIGYTYEGRKTLPTNIEFLGSGFIIGKKAEATCLVLTCNQVLAREYGSLRVRLSNTNEDLEATELFRDGLYDLGVLTVQGNFNDRPAIPLTDGTANDIAVGTLSALVSYYNPIGLRSELRTTRLFSVVPGAYGGYITGPPIDQERSGIIHPHTCYGIQGCSGGPLICHDSKHVIGVFQNSTVQVHMAISAETVHNFLKLWPIEKGKQVRDNDTILETIIRCEQLY